jgi:hypothetical protein
LRGGKPRNRKAVGRQAGCDQRREQRRRSGDWNDARAGRDRRRDDPIAWVRHQRRPGLRDQGDARAPGQQRRDLGGARAFIRVEARQDPRRLRDAAGLQQLAGAARVLGDDDVGVAQRLRGAR